MEAFLFFGVPVRTAYFISSVSFLQYFDVLVYFFVTFGTNDTEFEVENRSIEEQ